jgi:hypothetical protein
MTCVNRAHVTGQVAQVRCGGIAAVGQDVEWHQPHTRGKGVGPCLAFGRGAQVVHDADAERGERVNVGAGEPVQPGGAEHLSASHQAAIARAPNAQITQVRCRGQRDGVVRVASWCSFPHWAFEPGAWRGLRGQRGAMRANST